MNHQVLLSGLSGKCFRAHQVLQKAVKELGTSKRVDESFVDLLENKKSIVSVALCAAFKLTVSAWYDLTISAAVRKGSFTFLARIEVDFVYKKSRKEAIMPIGLKPKKVKN